MNKKITGILDKEEARTNMVVAKQNFKDLNSKLGDKRLELQALKRNFVRQKAQMKKDMA
jgi:hypothetical protein